MRISEVSQRSGVLATTIRFYESIGLLPSAPRVNGQRVYGADVLDRLAVIRFGLKTGFSLRELQLLFLGFGSRAKRRAAAQRKVKELKSFRERVRLMEKLLEEIRLCSCGTIQQIAKRLMESGVLNDGSTGLRRLVVSARSVTKPQANARAGSEGRGDASRRVTDFSPAK